MISKPRILLVCSSHLVVNQHLLEIIEKLRIHYSIELVTNFSFDENPFSNADDLIFHSLPIKRKPDIVSDILCIFLLVRILFNSHYHLILSFTPKGGLISSVAVLLHCLFLCRKVSFVHYFTGNLWRHRSRYSLSSLLLRSIDKFIVFMSNYSLFDSHTQVAHFKNLNFVDSKKLCCLGFGSLKGVDTNIFNIDSSKREHYRSKYLIPEKSFVLLYLGRINPDKGIATLLDIYTHLAKKYSDMYLLIVGPDDGFIFPDLPPNSKIRRFDFTAHPEVFYICSDLYILPSAREGFGSSVIEAASCGVPTIGSSIDGLNESIVHLKTGLLYDRLYPSQLLNSIEYLYLHRNHLAEFSVNARKRVLDQFNQDYVLDNLLNFLLTNV